MDRAKLGQLIDEIQKRLGISKAEIARQLGVQPAAISYWLSGERGISGQHLQSLFILNRIPVGADLAVHRASLELIEAIRILPLENAFRLTPSFGDVHRALAVYLSQLLPHERIDFIYEQPDVSFISLMDVPRLELLFRQLRAEIQKKNKIESMSSCEYLKWFCTENKIDDMSEFTVVIDDFDFMVPPDDGGPFGLYNDLFEIEHEVSIVLSGSYSDGFGHYHEDREKEVFFESYYRGSDEIDIDEFDGMDFREVAEKLSISPSVIEMVRNEVDDYSFDLLKAKFEKGCEKVFQGTPFKKQSEDYRHKSLEVVYSADSGSYLFKESLAVAYERFKNLQSECNF